MSSLISCLAGTLPRAVDDAGEDTLVVVEDIHELENVDGIDVVKHELVEVCNEFVRAIRMLCLKASE